MYPSTIADKFMLRLPGDMRDKIRDSAARNHRSMNSEIVFHLEKALAATEGQIGVGSSAAASSNNAALAGGASITNGY